MGLGSMLGGAATGAGTGFMMSGGNPWGIAAGAALGAGAAYMGDKEKKAKINQENSVQAEVTRYSPWTGMRGQRVQDDSSDWGNMLQGAATGAAMYQGGLKSNKPDATTGALTGVGDTKGAGALGSGSMDFGGSGATKLTSVDQMSMPAVGAVQPKAPAGLGGSTDFGVSTDFATPAAVAKPTLNRPGGSTWSNMKPAKVPAFLQSNDQYTGPGYISR